VKRANLVPHFGVAREIAVRGLGAVGPDGLGPRSVEGKQRLGRIVRPAVDQAEHRFDPLAVGEG